jgi:CBS domain containing-hemolysin-like protein
MDGRQLSAVALVDAEDHVIGQFAPEQLQKFLVEGNMELLHNPISLFVPVSQMVGDEISVTTSASLHHVLQAFRQSKSHRLFLVDEHRKLIGVLSLKDLLSILLK